MTLGDIFDHYHITPQFPPGAELQAKNMPLTVEKNDLKGRLDLSELLTFTIDGDDAKDFDDAISVSKNENGNYCLGVHIADVSHYVKKDSPIDKAAYLRGTSVYLVDTVVPMLPFELSNGLCSLVPKKTRLTLSVFMEFGTRGKLKGYEICESFICSKHRLTYKGASEILNKTKDAEKAYPKELCDALQLAKKLASVLHKKRIARGALDFVTQEAKIVSNAKGEAVEVERYPIYDSNRIIEEFMLAANETVAAHMQKNNLPGVYRVHGEPNAEKTERLLSVLPFMGVYDALKEGRKPKDYQKIIEEVKGRENENIVNYIVLRSMSKAEYSDECLGHFGLATKYYLHFTSPIRRYPDLAVHRILKAFIHKQNTADYALDAACTAVSATSAEINAADAENEWKKIKIAEFMSKKIGETFEGNISHITAKGFFVELDNTAEGFVSAATLSDDVYMLSENKLCLKGVSNGKEFTIGDRVKIKVEFADPETAKIDFILKSTGKKQSRKQITKSKKARKALKEFKKESREIKKEREERLFKIQFETEKAWQKAVENVLNPLTKALKAEKNAKRYVLTSFEDFWHLNVKALAKQASSTEVKNSADCEKYITGACYGLKKLISSLEESLEKNVDSNTKKICEKNTEKILKNLEKGLICGLGDETNKNESKSKAKSKPKSYAKKSKRKPKPKRKK